MSESCQNEHDFLPPVVMKVGGFLAFGQMVIAVTFCRRCGRSVDYKAGFGPKPEEVPA
jgi:hypothetical protein